MQRLLTTTLLATLIGCTTGQVDFEDPGQHGGDDDDDIGTSKGYATVRVFVLASGVTPDLQSLNSEGDDVTPDPPDAPGGGDYGTPQYYCPPDETEHDVPTRDPENDPGDESLYSVRLNVAHMSLNTGSDSVVLANADMEFAPHLPQSGIVLAKVPVGYYDKLSFTIAPREGFYAADADYLDSVAEYDSAHQADFAVDTNKPLGASSVYMAGSLGATFNFGGGLEDDYLDAYCGADEAEFCEHLDDFLYAGIPFEMRLSDRIDVELAPAGGIALVDGQVTDLIIRVDSSEWDQDWVSPLVHFRAGPVHVNDRYNNHWSETAATKVATAFTLE